MPDLLLKFDGERNGWVMGGSFYELRDHKRIASCASSVRHQFLDSIFDQIIFHKSIHPIQTIVLTKLNPYVDGLKLYTGYPAIAVTTPIIALPINLILISFSVCLTFA